MAVNIQDELIKVYLQQLFGGKTQAERERESINLQSAKLNLQNRYEKLYYQRIGDTKEVYDIKLLDEAHKRGKKYREDIVNNVYPGLPDKELFLEVIDSNQDELNRTKMAVQDYNSKESLYYDKVKELNKSTTDFYKFQSSSDIRDGEKAFEESKKIIEAITGDEGLISIYSDFSQKYAKRFKTDYQLVDFVSNQHNINKELLDNMKTGNFLSDFEYDMFSRANVSGNYKIIEDGKSQLRATENRTAKRGQDEIINLHTLLRNTFSQLKTGKDAESLVSLSPAEMVNLKANWPTHLKHFEQTLSNYEKNTGDMKMRREFDNVIKSPWTDEKELPPELKKKTEDGKLEPKTKLAIVTELTKQYDAQKKQQSVQHGQTVKFGNVLGTAGVGYREMLKTKKTTKMFNNKLKQLKLRSEKAKKRLEALMLKDIKPQTGVESFFDFLNPLDNLRRGSVEAEINSLDIKIKSWSSFEEFLKTYGEPKKEMDRLSKEINKHY